MIKGLCEARSQSYAQIRASTIVGVKKVRKESRTRPHVLKADSEATVDTGTARKSRAI